MEEITTITNSGTQVIDSNTPVIATWILFGIVCGICLWILIMDRAEKRYNEKVSERSKNN